MSLPDVLLSLLREPMAGTDLIRLFQSSIQHFWKTDLSQIYRALETLESKGLVRSSSEPSVRGPARRVYHLTEDGRARLLEWIANEPKIPPVKFEYLAQLFSVTAHPEPSVRAREMLWSMRDEAAAGLATLKGIDAAMSRIPGYPNELPSAYFYPWLTLRHGIHRRHALLEWIDECLERLDVRSPESDVSEGDHDSMALLARILSQLADEPPAEASSN